MQLEEDEEVISIVLIGKGERTFMAEADIKEFPERKDGGKEEVTVYEVFNRIGDLPKSTIALLY